MDRQTRLDRIASKMKHPAMNVSHVFNLMTDRLWDVDNRVKAHETFAVSISPDETPDERRNREWLEAIRTDYRAGLLN